MVPALIAWLLLAATVIGLAIYRRLVASREDDLIHLSPGEEKLISQQVKTTQALDKVDRMVKILTIVTAVFGLILAAVYLYRVWTEGLQPFG